MDIGGWLRGLGLERYERVFRENEIDERVLPKLTANDLKELGIAALGHRRLLLEAIAALRTDATSAEATPPPTASDIARPRPAIEGERRQLTIMFCDLVGSTALSARFDPEDLREIIAAYHRAVSDTVGRFAGFVAKYMGDGVLVYFGYPSAHEDDPESAVRAALATIEAVRRLDLPEDLAVRIGIATGLVVVGDLIGEGAAQERGVVGETPNLAARLQALAQPETLVIAENTGARSVRCSMSRISAYSRWPASRSLSGRGAFSARAAKSAASRPCARWRRRWSGVTRNWSFCCAVGSKPRQAKAGSCWSRASRGSASRG
jgi:class 3 adenylate cyclase